MAIKTLKELVLSVNYNRGKDEKGKDIIKYQKYKGINLQSQDADIYAVGNAISNLLEYPLVSIERQEDSVLTETQL